MRLGWSPGHDDILTKEEAASALSTIGSNRARRRRGSTSRSWTQSTRTSWRWRTIRGWRAWCWRFIEQRDGATLGGAERVTLANAIPVLKKRAKTIPDLAEQARFVLAKRPLTLDEKSKSLLKDDFKQRLQRLHDRLAKELAWDHVSLGSRA